MQSTDSDIGAVFMLEVQQSRQVELHYSQRIFAGNTLDMTSLLCYNDIMSKHKNIKRTSLYIPLELSAKVQESANIERRSFNQEILALVEIGLSIPIGSRKRKKSPAQTEFELNLEPSKKQK